MVKIKQDSLDFSATEFNLYENMENMHEINGNAMHDFFLIVILTNANYLDHVL